MARGHQDPMHPLAEGKILHVPTFLVLGELCSSCLLTDRMKMNYSVLSLSVEVMEAFGYDDEANTIQGSWSCEYKGEWTACF